MGELGGFLKFAARGDAGARPGRARRRLPRVRAHAAVDRAARAGRALHGVRRAVLPPRLPARQPDPGLERPRLPRPVARGDRRSCTARTTSRSSPAGSARRRARRRACSRSARATPSRSSRSSSRSSTAPGTRAGSCRSRRRADGQDGRGDRLRAGGHGVRAAAPPRRPRGHRVRARRGRRRARALRRPRLQDREARRRAARRAARAEGVEFRFGVDVGGDVDRTSSSASTRS